MKEYSKRELRQIKRADELRIIGSVIYLILRFKFPWKKIYHPKSAAQDAEAWRYIATAKINNIDVGLEHFKCGLEIYLTISCGEEKRTVLRPIFFHKKLRSDFDRLHSLIKEYAVEESVQQPKQDTTLVLPNPPDGLTDKEKLWRVIDFMTNS